MLYGTGVIPYDLPSLDLGQWNLQLPTLEAPDPSKELVTLLLQKGLS